MTAPAPKPARWAMWLPLALFVGFVLLTVTGLLLIAILILYNLKKEAIHAGLGRLKQRFAGWS